MGPHGERFRVRVDFRGNTWGPMLLAAELDWRTIPLQNSITGLYSDLTLSRSGQDPSALLREARGLIRRARESYETSAVRFTIETVVFDVELGVTDLAEDE